jgi:hypothetical protein
MGLLLLLLMVALDAWLATQGALDAETPLRQARTSLDLATIRDALDRYCVDWGELPRPDIREGDGWLPASLTTPIPYLEALPRDGGAPPGETYRYWVDGRPRRLQALHWLVASRGLDGKPDLPPLAGMADLPGPVPGWLVARFAYDPTNGAGSRGDDILWAER